MKGPRYFWIACLEVFANRLQRRAFREDMASGRPEHLRTGEAGEQAAFFYLLKQGYTIVATRWSPGNLDGDLDLVAWKNNTLCFFEVKTRTNHDAYSAESAVDEHKRKILRRLTREYLRHLHEQPEVRFDVLSVYLLPAQKPQFKHFENAFQWSEKRRDPDDF